MVTIKNITDEERELRIKRKEISSLVKEEFPLMNGFLTSDPVGSYCIVYSILRLRHVLNVDSSSPESPRLTLKDEGFYDRANSLAEKIEKKGRNVHLILDYSK